MKKTLTFISSAFVIMNLANIANANTIELLIDSFDDEAYLGISSGETEVEKSQTDDLQYVLGGQRTVKLSIDECTKSNTESKCADLDIGINMKSQDGELSVQVSPNVVGKATASVSYNNLMNIDGTKYSGVLANFRGDLEVSENENFTFKLSIESDSDFELYPDMVIESSNPMSGYIYFPFSGLTDDQLTGIKGLTLSSIGTDSAYDYIVTELGFTTDDSPPVTKVPESSNLMMGLASVLGLGIFAKRGKKQV